MAIIDECIRGAVAIGNMSAKGAAEFAARMKDAEALAAQRGMAGPAAYTFAISEAAKNMEKRATARRAMVQQHILAVDRAWSGAKDNSKGVGYGLTAVFGERVAGKGETPSIGQQHRGNLATIQSIMSDFLSRVQSRGFGLIQDHVLSQHVIRAGYGEATPSAMGEPAFKAWDAAMTWWRDEMQRAGVTVKELKDWLFPQHFDSAAVRAMGRERFIETMEGWWRSNSLLLRDWKADGDAYLAPGFADQRVREILDTAYGNITGGEPSIEPGAIKGHTMADKYNRRRAFEWATADAWLDFNRTMGVGDSGIGELMIRHMDNISRDLGVVQVLGPDPDSAARTLLQMYAQQGGSRLWGSKLAAIYDISSGKASNPVSQRLAVGAQSFRQFLTAAQLGNAVLAATSDLGFMRATAAWHGLSMTSVMSRYVDNLKPSSAADRAEAMRSGLILEVGMRGLRDAARDTINDVVARAGVGGKVDAALNGLSRVTGRMAEVVIRAQGLAHHTQSARDAIGAELMAHLGSVSSKTWDQLDNLDRRTFETYGMGAKDWDVLRTKAVTQGILDPAMLARSAQVAAAGGGAERDAAVKMLGAIAAIQRMAVPEANAVTRALIMGGTQPGTVPGEVLRSVAQYKGFPMSAFLMHYFRSLESLADHNGQWFRGQYIASLVIATTVLGAASLQLKNIAAGKDPEPMWDRNDGTRAFRFWSYAFAQGGAGGIIGDQFKALASASQSADPSRMLTPTGGFVADVFGLTRGNLGQTIGGQKANTGREAVNFMRKYTPDVFYTKLAMDRVIYDTLQKMWDSDYSSSFSRIEERARREQSTEMYWGPGQTTPRRPPDFSRLVK